MLHAAYELLVNALGAKFIFDYCNFETMVFFQYSIEKRSLARAQKAGQDRHWYLLSFHFKDFALKSRHESRLKSAFHESRIQLKNFVTVLFSLLKLS